ncbi:DUF3822 family protein [Bacteroidales bacterium SW299]|nr:DUF3822 family protein [Bacteroidales bacterium SW299]
MIDFNQPDRYTLSIRLSTDGFSFAIHPDEGGEDVLFRTFHVNPQHSMAANVKEFLAETDTLKHAFRQTNILIHTSRYTPVPFELYEDDQTELLFYQNLPKQNNEIILCNILSKSNIAILFSIDKLTHQLLSDYFPKARFFASISPTIEYLTLRSRKNGNSRAEVFAILHQKSLDLLAFKNQKPVLANSFKASNMNDKCYYLLNLWKQLNLDQQQDVLYVDSKQPKQDLMKSLALYLQNIIFINPRTEFTETATSRIEGISSDILCLISCE